MASLPKRICRRIEIPFCLRNCNIDPLQICALSQYAPAIATLPYPVSLLQSLPDSSPRDVVLSAVGPVSAEDVSFLEKSLPLPVLSDTSPGSLDSIE